MNASTVCRRSSFFLTPDPMALSKPLAVRSNQSSTLAASYIFLTGHLPENFLGLVTDTMTIAIPLETSVRHELQVRRKTQFDFRVACNHETLVMIGRRVDGRKGLLHLQWRFQNCFSWSQRRIELSQLVEIQQVSIR